MKVMGIHAVAAVVLGALSGVALAEAPAPATDRPAVEAQVKKAETGSTETRVRAPYTDVDVGGDRVAVDAPYTGVRVDRDRVRVRAPFVDLDIRR